MAEPLKNLFNRALMEALLDDFEAVGHPLERQTLLNLIFCEEWESLELKERLRHITRSLHEVLQLPFAEAIAILKPIAGLQAPGFEHMVFPDYVEVYGLEEDWELAMDALEHFTQFSSSEFAIRPFIMKSPEKTMKRMLAWSQHPNEHVRRLASEGCRPRLPWAMALPDFKKDPSPVLPVLEALKKDPSEYVRRSVANNLNDIAKDHPDIVLNIGRKWLGNNKETDWIVKHASRSLLRQGNTEALMLFGFGDPEKVQISALSTQEPEVKIGDYLHFSFELLNTAPQALKLRLEYGIYYLKSNGRQNRKVFMITENEYAPEKKHSFGRKQSFRNMTTRKHYVGPHRLVIIVNGLEQAECGFVVN